MYKDEPVQKEGEGDSEFSLRRAKFFRAKMDERKNAEEKKLNPVSPLDKFKKVWSND